LVGGELGERGVEILHVHVAVLLGRASEPCGIFTVGVFDFAFALAALREIRVAQDGE